MNAREYSGNHNSVPRVFLVDDDHAVLAALSRVLRSAGLEVVAHTSAEDFIAHYRPTAPACLVVALRLPALSGLDLQEWLAQSCDPLPLIFISRHTDIPATVRAMKAGAVDFLTKPVNSQQLLLAVDDALQWQRERISECAEIAAVERRVATLTPREREVLTHVVSGQLNKQIAGDLGTVEKTIKVHRARVMRKMEAHSLAELVRMIARIDRDAHSLTPKFSQSSETILPPYANNGNGLTERMRNRSPAACTKTSSHWS